MADYKELVAKCDYWINLGDEIDKKLAITKFMEECRDAIEQLAKERDAAMTDIRVSCKTCRHSYLNNASGNDCDSVGSYACNWEWRGVQEGNDEIN